MRCDVCPRRCTLEEGMIPVFAGQGRTKAAGASQLITANLHLSHWTRSKKNLWRDFTRKQDPLRRHLRLQHGLPLLPEPFDRGCFRGGCKDKVRSPSELARLAGELKDKGNIGVAFTYNEPMIGYEYVRDVSVETKKMGMKNVVVTNGCVLPDILDRVLPWVDAFNIDLKSFSEETYRKLGGDLKTVKDFIICAAKRSHIEITTLIVPGMNESEDEIKALSGWIAGIEKSIPLHITRFFPQRKMSHCMPTDIDLLGRLFDTAKKNLDNVFIGNV